MPWAAIIPAVIGAAGSIGGAYLANKDKGGGGGVASFSPSNPAQFTLNQLFGTKLHKHKHGADAGTVSLVNDRRNPGIFSGPEFRQSLLDFAFNPLLPSQGEQDFIGGLLQSAPGRLDTTLSALGGLRDETARDFDTARGNALDLVNTGFATDASPIYESAISNFEREALPAIAERQGTFGGGILSSGFQNLAGREARNLLDQAAQVQVGLNEAANQRRAGAVPLLGTLAGQRSSLLSSLIGTEAALPGAFGQDTLNLGTGFRNIFEAARARPIDVFSQLANLGGPGTSGFLQGGFSPQGSATADVLSSLSSNAGGIAELITTIGGLFGGGPGGGAQLSAS